MVAALVVYCLIADCGCDPRQQFENAFVGLAFRERLDDLCRLFEITVWLTHRATMPEHEPTGNAVGYTVPR